MRLTAQHRMHHSKTIQVRRLDADPASGPDVPVVLGSFYVRVENTADKLQLNSDGSFLLQESGRAYHGRFSLLLNISEIPGHSTTAIIQGASLVDNDGSTWARRAHPGWNSVRAS